NTGWREAAPAEVESYIVEPQEAVLRNVPGVTEISSFIGRGFGSISLEFAIGTDMQEALINAINALNQAPPLPVDASEPQVFSGASGNNGQNVATLQIRPKPDNPNTDLYDPAYQHVIENVLQPRLARIQGVSSVQLNSLRAPGAGHLRSVSRRCARHFHRQHRADGAGLGGQFRGLCQRRPPPVHGALRRPVRDRATGRADRRLERRSPRAAQRDRRRASRPCRSLRRQPAQRLSGVLRRP